jgi:hypothetical protein
LETHKAQVVVSSEVKEHQEASSEVEDRPSPTEGFLERQILPKVSHNQLEDCLEVAVRALEEASSVEVAKAQGEVYLEVALHSKKVSKIYQFFSYKIQWVTKPNNSCIQRFVFGTQDSQSSNFLSAGGLFGSSGGGGMMGQSSTSGGGLFGQTKPPTTGGGLFGQSKPSTGMSSGGGIFGGGSTSAGMSTGGGGGGLFGSKPATSTGLFSSSGKSSFFSGGPSTAFGGQGNDQSSFGSTPQANLQDGTSAIHFNGIKDKDHGGDAKHLITLNSITAEPSY